MFKKILLVFCIFGLFLTSPSVAEARLNLVWPPSPLGTVVQDGVGIPTVIQYFYEWMIVLGGLAAFIAFVWAGIIYMTSVGDANKMTEAKKKIKNALVGLVLLLSSVLIFNIINPHLTALKGTGAAVDDIPGLSPDLRDRINSFINAYSQCLSVAMMRKYGEITIPIPLLRITFNPFPTERESEIAYPHYHSFLGGTIGNCAEFRSRVINRRTNLFRPPFYIGGDKISSYGDLIERLRLSEFP